MHIVLPLIIAGAVVVNAASLEATNVEEPLLVHDQKDVDFVTSERMMRLLRLNGQPETPQLDLGEAGHRARRVGTEMYGTFKTSYGATMHAHKDICVSDKSVAVVVADAADYYTWKQCCVGIISSSMEADSSDEAISIEDCPVWIRESCATLQSYSGDYTLNLWTAEEADAKDLLWLDGTSYWWNTHQRVEQFGHIMNRVTNIFHMVNDPVDPITFNALVSSRMRLPSDSQHSLNLIEAVIGNSMFQDSWWRNGEGLRQVRKASSIDKACMRRALDLDWGVAERTFWNQDQKWPFLNFMNEYFPKAPLTAQFPAATGNISLFPTGADTRIVDSSWNATYVTELKSSGGTTINIPVTPVNISSTAAEENLFCAPPTVGVMHRIEGTGNRVFLNYDILERVLAKEGITKYENFTVWSGNSSEEQIGAFRQYGLLIAPISSQLKNSVFMEGINAIIEVAALYPGYIVVSPFAMGPDQTSVYFETSEAHLPDYSSCPESHGCQTQKQYKTDIYMLEYLLTDAINLQLTRLRNACPEWDKLYPANTNDTMPSKPQENPTSLWAEKCSQSNTDCEIWQNIDNVCEDYPWWAVQYCAETCGIECSDSYEF
eukprot:CFRG0288T1